MQKTKIRWSTTATTTFEIMLDSMTQEEIDTLFDSADMMAEHETGVTEVQYDCTDRYILETHPVEVPDKVTVVKVEVYDPATQEDYSEAFAKLFDFDMQTRLDISPETGNLYDAPMVEGWDFSELLDLWCERKRRHDYLALDWDRDDDVQGFVLYGARKTDGLIRAVSFKIGSADGDFDDFEFVTVMEALDLSYRIHYSDGTVA